jgi:hypothetical protein
MSNIRIQIKSPIHRKMLDSFKKEHNIKTDTNAILQIIEFQRIQKNHLIDSLNEIKILKIRMTKIP